MNSIIKQRAEAIIKLGEILNEVVDNEDLNKPDSISASVTKLRTAIEQASLTNKWFTQDSIELAFRSWAYALQADKVWHWLDMYKDRLISQPKITLGIIMAGNIPMVGFHDLLCGIISGQNLIAKLSSDDDILIPAISDVLCSIMPEIEPQINLTSGKLHDFDVVIATGSNNTSRYFEYYFGKYPSLIRKNRNGVAVLSGHESEAELKGLGEDIFNYFGLGCRSVSKLYIPMDYNPDDFVKHFDDFSETGNHSKYVNNYDYQKAILIINNTPFYDNGFMLLKEDSSLISPISLLHFEKYSNTDELNLQLDSMNEEIQCITSIDKNINNAIKPGLSQYQGLWDYADEIDTLEFLIDCSG